MELVYLWVEDYKNIKKQGFDFSPKFECIFHDEYNDDGTLKDDCVLDIKPKEHIEIFFGKNINVTAIVGENGSGKSSIIKLILMLIFYKNYNNTSDYENEIQILKQEIKNKALFLIIKTTDGFKKISLNNTITCQFTCDELDNTKIDFYSIYFSYMLDTLQNNKDYWMWNLYHKSDGYETPILLTPNKFHKDFLQNSINLDDIEYINIKHSIKFYKKNIKTKINHFFNPNQIKLYSDNPSTIQEVEFNFFGKVAGKFLDLNKATKKDNMDEYYKNLNKKLIEIKDLEVHKNYEKINLLYIAFKILSSAKSNFETETYENVDKWFNEKLYDDEFLEEGVTLIKSKIDNIFIDDTIKYNNEKINDCIEFHKNISDNKKEILNKLLERETLGLSDFGDITLILIPWLDLELLENEKSFNTLSGGQKLFFTFMVNMMYEVSNLIQEDKYKTINLFLDEVEASYHPNWQKEFIKNISKALENIDLKDKKINLFFSTHSPFILSDLPKKNVIFLKKDENENCKNVTKEINIDTFGANIHTLLSHGFFMKDGLMGEFAKGKIKEIKEFYDNHKDLKKDDVTFQDKKSEYESKKYNFRNIQNIIGEPFLKTIIGNYLGELEILFYGKKEFLKKEIERLQKLEMSLNDEA
jgi:predicted ATPase